MAGTTRYSAAQAVARAAATTSWPKGMCLAFAFDCVHDVKLGVPDAHAALDRAEHLEASWPPPPGSLVYWRGGPHGHIAVSAGRGSCYSTDMPTDGRVSKVPLSAIRERWGHTYAGWSRDYCGLMIPGLEPPTKQEESVTPEQIEQVARRAAELVLSAPIKHPTVAGRTWPLRDALWSANVYAYRAADVERMADAVAAALPETGGPNVSRDDLVAALRQVFGSLDDEAEASA